MNQLKPVRITKKDTCLSYVLKRKGLDAELYNFAEDIPLCDFVPIDINKLVKGDILVWKHNIPYIEKDTAIDNENDIPYLITTSVFRKFHFGIIEHIEKKDKNTLITFSELIIDSRWSLPYLELAVLVYKNKTFFAGFAKKDGELIEKPEFLLNHTK